MGVFDNSGFSPGQQPGSWSLGDSLPKQASNGNFFTLQRGASSLVPNLLHCGGSHIGSQSMVLLLEQLRQAEEDDPIHIDPNCPLPPDSDS